MGGVLTKRLRANIDDHFDVFTPDKRGEQILRVIGMANCPDRVARVHELTVPERRDGGIDRIDVRVARNRGPSRDD